MSLLWPDRSGVALFPDRLVLTRVSGGMRQRLLQKEILNFAPAEPGTPSWRPAVDVLTAKVSSGALARADVTLILSNRFVNYTVVRSSESLRNQEEEMAFARHCFARIHGSDAEKWKITIDSATPRGSRLACAVEPALIEALSRCMSPLGRRYRCLRPHLMASVNRWHKRIGARTVWLVVAEPGLLCLALLQDGCWHSVRTLRAGPDWPQDLIGMLNREECLVDGHSQCEEVLLFAPDGPQPLVLEAGKWRISRVLPTLLPEMDIHADAPFSIALGT